MELIGQAKIDYFALNCYRSNVAKDCPKEESYLELALNKEGKKGQFVYPKFPGEYALAPNPYVETTDWDWEIDPVAMRYMLRYVWDHYRLPMMITENGLGAHEQSARTARCTMRTGSPSCAIRSIRSVGD